MADGVFVEGLKMPPSCADCPCYNAEYLYCNLRNSIDISLETRPSACRLVSVADVRPVVRGRWIPVGLDDADEGMFKCSECGSEHFFPEILLGIPADNYCPNCGAMMEES